MFNTSRKEFRDGLISLIWILFFLSLIFTAATTMAFPLPEDIIADPQTGVATTNSGTRTPTIIKASSVVGRQPAGPARALRLPNQPIVDGNTVALYHLDSASGSNVIDATGNYTATLHGNAVITSAGLYAGALHLDGAGSYIRTGYLGTLISGTIEAFVDFRNACLSNYDTIVSVGGEFGSGQQPVLWLGRDTGLIFKMFTNNRLYVVDSGINPCRYLDGGNKGAYFQSWGFESAPWPYETWRFHHVAATWGPRGVEIWVDGVLHGTVHESCNPQRQVTSSRYPECDSPRPGPDPGADPGGLPPYSTVLIGCSPDGTCFNGRIDEVRISNIQRTFSYTIVPPSSPTPTQTPEGLLGGYTVDAYTVRLYHLDQINPPSQVVIEASGNNARWEGSPSLMPGRFGNAYALRNGSSIHTGDPGVTSNGTVEAWINPETISVPFAIFTAGLGLGQGGNEMLLGVPNGATTLRFGIIGTEGIVWADSGINPALLMGCWHHVAGTWGRAGLQIWIDGELRGTYNYYGTRAWPTYEFIYGCDSLGRCMNGKIDEIRISNVQRTFSANRLARGVNSVPAARLPVAEGSRVFLPLIGVYPTPTPSPCQFGQ